MVDQFADVSSTAVHSSSAGHHSSSSNGASQDKALVEETPAHDGSNSDAEEAEAFCSSLPNRLTHANEKAELEALINEMLHPDADNANDADSEQKRCELLAGLDDLLDPNRVYQDTAYAALNLIGECAVYQVVADCQQRKAAQAKRNVRPNAADPGQKDLNIGDVTFALVQQGVLASFPQYHV